MFEQIVAILFPVISLVLIGYLIGLWLKPDFRPINRINMDAFVPALVFSSLVSMPLDTQQTPLLLAALVAVLLPGLLMLIACRLGGWSFKTWAPLHMFRNSGNLAIPLFTYAFGETALPSAVLLFVVSMCLHISLGVAMLSKGSVLKTVLSAPEILSLFAGFTVQSERSLCLVTLIQRHRFTRASRRSGDAAFTRIANY